MSETGFVRDKEVIIEVEFNAVQPDFSVAEIVSFPWQVAETHVEETRPDFNAAKTVSFSWQVAETRVEETAYLLSSPNNARRLHEALNRDPKDRIRFDDLGSLRDEVGI
ncbi:MAG: hypothetical protein OXE49_10230 [Gemmatimonadetes bacterium]|nr:hypothetical protein [Gemmatimonadota bacterium]